MDTPEELRLRQVLSALMTERFEDYGITKVKLAQRMGVSVLSVGRYLDGKRTATVPAIRAFCRALRIDAGAFWDELEDRLARDEPEPKV